MVKKLKSELVPLTRELAEKFDKMQPLPGERPKHEPRLKYFAALLRGGAFQSPTWAVAILDGVQYRADGQHTSHVLATCMDEWFPRGQSVTIHTYGIDSKSDAVDLFDVFDNPISARSNLDKMGVYLAECAELAGIDRNFLGKVARGIDYVRREANKDGQFQQTFVSRDHGLYFMDEWCRRFALWLYPMRVVKARQGGGEEPVKHSWMFNKPGIVAEMLADWSANADMALSFWNEVLTESNPDPGDETRELCTTLKDWSQRQPRVKQEKFRTRARRTWERYRKLAAAQAGSKAA